VFIRLVRQLPRIHSNSEDRLGRFLRGWRGEAGIRPRHVVRRFHVVPGAASAARTSTGLERRELLAYSKLEVSPARFCVHSRPAAGAS